MSGGIRLAIDGSIARVTITRPDKFNAMTRAMWRELRRVFLALQADNALRCAIVAGEGGHFCAGGDIGEYPGFRFDEERLRDFHETEVWGGLSAMLACDLPLLAVIDGNCMGAGMEIASCCDIRLASEGARFGAPIAKLGFPMAPREAQLVAREAGLGTAREMLLEAAVFDASEMKARGFLQAVLPAPELAAQADARARRIAALAPRAARLNKQTLRALNAGEPMEAVVAVAYHYADHPEHREGIGAFLAKRPPRF